MTRLLISLLLLFGFTAAQETGGMTGGETGGASSDSVSFPLTITDGAGRELTLGEPPERVVCYYTSCIEALVTLGLKPIAVPVWFEQFPNQTLLNTPNGMSDVEIIPVENDTPSPEVIASLQADLVMVNNEEAATAIQSIVPTFVTYNIDSIDDTLATVPRYGRLFGRVSEAETAVETFEARLAAYAAEAPGDLTVMNVGIDESDPTGGDLYVRSTNSPDCAILNMIARCPWEEPQPSGSWSFDTNIEYLLQQDPDVIMVSIYDADAEAIREAIASDPLWRELSAVKNDYLILAPDDLSADGVMIATRFVDYVAPELYPDAFPEPLTDEEVQEILAESE